MILPEIYLETMQKLLGDEYPEFLNSYDKPRRNGLRVNTGKITPEEFEKITPFPLERIPWTSNGYYVDWHDQPARHPYYKAGLYYLQEPSAMAPAQILPVSPGNRVLDLCAAPGGKATELGSRLGIRLSGMRNTAGDPRIGSSARTQYGGCLVANEISASRAKALLRNLELFGIPNICVTNTSPEKLLERFPAYFDRILVDAPCSGEGMFRKDPEMASAWYSEKPAECAAVQREIIVQAADMLRAGGIMVYSTCTFEICENEDVIRHLLQERPEMELVQIDREGGRSSFSSGIGMPQAVRIWPHKTDGEGHFIAMMRKKSDDMECVCGAEEELRNAAVCRTEDTVSEVNFGEIRQRKKEQGNRNAQKRGKKDRTHANGGKSQAPESYEQITDFLNTILFYNDRDGFDCRQYEIHGESVFLNPKEKPDLKGISFLRCGLYLGELKKNRFEPSQELAMALSADSITPDVLICLSPEDPRIAQYLHGESIRIEEEPTDGDEDDQKNGLQGRRENGWKLLCVGQYPLGWGKLVNGVLKNKYPQAWRT